MTFFNLITLAGMYLIKQDINKHDSKIEKLEYLLHLYDSTNDVSYISQSNNLIGDLERDLEKINKDRLNLLTLESKLTQISDEILDLDLSEVELAYLKEILASEVDLTSIDLTIYDNIIGLSSTFIDAIKILTARMSNLSLEFGIQYAEVIGTLKDNSEFMFRMNDRLIELKLSSLREFDAIQKELKMMNDIIDTKLADFGILSTLNIAAILNDGSFKLAENLTPLPQVHGITTKSDFTSSVTGDINDPMMRGYANSIGTNGILGIYNTYYIRLRSGFLTSPVTSPIKRIGIAKDSGSMYDSRFLGVLISNITITSDPIYVLLKGEGLNSVTSGFTIRYVPGRVLDMTPKKETIDGIVNYSPNWVMKQTKYGANRFIYPLFSNFSLPQLFDVSVINLSDKLLAIRIKVKPANSVTMTNYGLIKATVTNKRINQPTMSGGRAVGYEDSLFNGDIEVSFPSGMIAEGVTAAR